MAFMEFKIPESHENYTVIPWLMLIGCELLGLILANVLGIMIAHGKGTYQATRIMRWDIHKVVPQFGIANLVNITPISLYGFYIRSIYHDIWFINQLITGHNHSKPYGDPPRKVAVQIWKIDLPFSDPVQQQKTWKNTMT